MFETVLAHGSGLDELAMFVVAPAVFALGGYFVWRPLKQSNDNQITDDEDSDAVEPTRECRTDGAAKAFSDDQVGDPHLLLTAMRWGSWLNRVEILVTSTPKARQLQNTR